MLEGWTVRWRQTKILLKKNFLISKRNIRGTVVQILVPFIFVFLLWVLQFGVENNNRLSDLIKSAPSSQPTDPQPVPRCLKGLDKDTCYTIAYVTNDARGDDVINKIAQENGIPSSEIRKFADSNELDVFLDSDHNSTQAAVIFNFTTISRGNISFPMSLYQYTIQYNHTDVYVHNQLLDKMQYLVVPLQTSVERYLSKLALTDEDFEMKVSYAPFAHPELLSADVMATSGPAFIYGSLMFNVVVQLGHIAHEREFSLREAMSMMGLVDSVYWLTWFVNNSIFNVASALVLIISGYIFQIEFFLNNDFGTFFFLFVLFSLSMVPVVFFLATLVSKSSTATSVGFVVYLVGIIIQGLAPSAFTEDFYDWLRIIFSFLPFALLAKGISDLANDSKGVRWSARSTNAWFSLDDVYKWLIIDFFLFFVLALYLDNVLPNNFGVRKPFYYFLQPSYWLGTSSKNSKKGDNTFIEPVDSNKIEPLEMKKEMDVDIIAERDKVLTGNLPASTAVKITHLYKVFNSRKKCRKSTYTAVNDMCLSIDSGQLFCLLGHNGAGKTTTISMLTGLVVPTSGDATIFGHSIRDQMAQIRAVMGVCPQHDILWDQLTGKEHLEMFAKFKGIPYDEIEHEINSRLEDVDLVKSADVLASQYSGGMKRRLSTAIALIANPRIVFLDEPTTGMDPVSRRQVWNLIEKAKRGRVIVLTTHSMEEADILGDRIGIMKKGKLVVLGTPLHLKNKFGTGYKITILTENNTDSSPVKSFFAKSLGLTPVHEVLNMLEFVVPRDQLPQLASFFSKLESKQRKLKIRDIQLTLTTLEEVFLHIAGEPEDS